MFVGRETSSNLNVGGKLNQFFPCSRKNAIDMKGTKEDKHVKREHVLFVHFGSEGPALGRDIGRGVVREFHEVGNLAQIPVHRVGVTFPLHFW